MHLPDKIFAVTAESGLLEKPRDELVVFDVEALLLTQSASSSELFQFD
jgi:hypothetical protein